MAKPGSFKYSYVALHNIPYIEAGESYSASCGGVLGRGEVVWTDHLHQEDPSRVKAFLESVGVVSLDPRWLVPPELYQGVAH